MRWLLGDRASPDRSSSHRGLLAGGLVDSALYASGAAVCVVVLLASGHTIHRVAAWWALGAYVAAALVSVMTFRAAGVAARSALAAGVLIVGGLLPMLVMISDRQDDPTGHHSHAETAVIESGASVLVAGSNPYSAEFDQADISFWSEPVRSHFPYLPGMLVLGMPRTLAADSPLADGRITFIGLTMVILCCAFPMWQRSSEAKLRVFQLLLVLPSSLLVMVGGGHDLPIVALLFLGVVLLERGLVPVAALPIGLAVASRQLAWVPAILIVVWLWVAGRRPAAMRFAGVVVALAVLVAAPFVIWSPADFWEDVVRWPLNLGDQLSNAAGPSAGRWLTSGGSGGLAVAAAMLALAGFVAASIRRPPRSLAATLRRSALVLAVLMLLAPAARFGYAIYPVCLFGWAILLEAPRRRPATRDTAGTEVPAVRYATGDLNPEPAD
jgi:hypothetical protein